MRLVWGIVSAVVTEGEDAQSLVVEIPGRADTARAVNYRHLAGACAEGEHVLLNTTAVDLALGTGGVHFVVARAGSGVALDEPSGGHIMKLRYTPLQRDVLVVEEMASPHHTTMAAAESLEGMPVVCCGLHSQVPLVAAAIKGVGPKLRVGYCYDDAAALPSSFSRVLAESTRAGLIDSVVTCGQAFGGELEAVNLHSGLLAAYAVAGADVAITGIGPGVVGTGTPFGHGGVAQGEAINAVASLDGRPVAVLRLSAADERARHVGVSHHSLTTLARVALAQAVVAVPTLDEGFRTRVENQLAGAAVWKKHVRANSPGATPDMRSVTVSTMGRVIEDDPAFFSAAFAAGEVAAAMALTGR